MQEQGYLRSGRALVKTGTPGVYKRGGAYVVVFRDATGRQRKRSARSLAEARTLRAQLVSAVASGEYRDTSKATFRDYAAEWFPSYQGRGRTRIREHSKRQYRRWLDKEIIPYFGGMKLAAIEPRHVKAFAARLSARGLAPASVSACLAVLKSALADAHDDGAIRFDPSARVRVAQPVEQVEDGEHEKGRALTDDQLRKLLAATPADHRLVFELMAHTGLRASECIGLEWRHVDAAKRLVHVRQRDYQGELGPPKSRAGRRDVPLSPQMARALREHRMASRFKTDTDPVFARSSGERQVYVTVLGRLKRAADKAGLGNVTCHDLRRTATTLQRNRGATAEQAALMMGHAKASMTVDVYSRPTLADLPDPSFLDAITRPQEGGNRGATRRAETSRDTYERARG